MNYSYSIGYFVGYSLFFMLSALMIVYIYNGNKIKSFLFWIKTALFCIGFWLLQSVIIFEIPNQIESALNYIRIGNFVIIIYFFVPVLLFRLCKLGFKKIFKSNTSTQIGLKGLIQE